MTRHGESGRGAGDRAAPAAWHALPPATVAAQLGLDEAERGLAEAEAAARLARVGRNRLPPPRPVTLAEILLHQFLSPLIYVLLAAAAIAVLLDDYADAGFILIVIAINAGLGAWQEWRAERSAADLQRLIEVQARTRREGRERTLPAEELVPGDVVLVESGDRVPADLRLVRCRDLHVDESLLTGESMPVAKASDELAADAPVADRRNMAFAGAVVTSGRGRGIVVATGTATEIGRLAHTVAATRAQKAPLVVRLEQFARHVSFGVLAACLVVAAIGLARGMAPAEVFFLAVALAVSAIPEGLPVAVTVALSIATVRMARRRVIVRRLAAVEGLGSCTVIASDKTGTLTVNRQTLRHVTLPGGEHLGVSGEGHDGAGTVTDDTGEPPSPAAAARLAELVRAGVLCNEATLVRRDGAWWPQGDAIDVALLALAHKVGLDPDVVRGGVQIEAELPFESERAFAAVLYQQDGRRHVAVKGALERLLPRCATMRTDGGVVPIDAALLEQQAHELSSTGHRFLLVAGATLPAGAAATLDEATLPPLTALGLIGLIDPPRPEAVAAVRQCRDAGIGVRMVTGDHPLTAFAIAREVGIAEEERQIVTGHQLAQAGEPGSARFDELVARGRVFARVAPLQKLQIVEGLRRQGHFVAVTGDGVNDAPALRAANIGVAMGSGSAVTKDTAALIVTDDNFASIEAGVEEGRFAYDNIRKVTYLLVSTGLAEVLLLLTALSVGLPLPLLAVQLLWLNLVTNGIQHVALAFEAGEPGTMRRPPRSPREGIFNRKMLAQTLVSGVAISAIATTFWSAALAAGLAETVARNQLLLLFVLLENVHVFNCRSEYESTFAVPLARNKLLALAVPAALGVHVLAMHVPFLQRLLGVEPVPVADWGVLVVSALVVLLVMEVYKVVARRRRRAAAG
ncbi:MAG: HAD-IC family P-type ATPase [Planctomycetes bacterium]|nr:HAD-IC family P-type ATPase [Planctomycetota bacterium]